MNVQIIWLRISYVINLFTGQFLGRKDNTWKLRIKQMKKEKGKQEYNLDKYPNQN